jgi:CHC2 zinc finger
MADLKDIKEKLDLREIVLQSHPEAKREGQALKLRCVSPSHKDDRPSLAVYERRYKCFACGLKGDVFDWLELEMQCSKSEAIKEAAKLAGVDLPGGSKRASVGCTLEEYAESKHLSADFLRGLGLQDVTHNYARAVRMPFYGADGQEVSTTQYRVRLDKVSGGDGRFQFKKGSKAVIYGQDRLSGEEVALVEGASDAHTLWYHGITACALPGCGQWKESRDARLFEQVQTIYAPIEPDAGGQILKRSLAASSIRTKVRLVTLPGFKDVSDMHVADEAGFKERWAAACASAMPLEVIQKEERAQELEEARREANDLLMDSRLFDRIREAIVAGGYAGEPGPALVAYVAMTSRLLQRPINLAFVAPAAAGKNRAVDAAVQLMPEEAVYQLSAGSPRALIYAEGSFEHVMVVLREADSISFAEDGPAASAIRAIVDDNHMRYAVVEQGSDGQQKTRTIDKPGPTGLITTSIKSVAHQLGTRVLEMPIPDTKEQTRLILDALAMRAEGEAPENVDLAPFIALQRYLALSDVRVVVPFARQLFRLISADQVRMRRDGQKLRAGIEAVALLYQCQRERDADGRIIATLDDYALARELLVPAFEIIQADGLTPAVREAVEKIGEEEKCVSIATLEARLNLGGTATRYRVKRALAEGWLVDDEDRDRRGRAAKLRRGQPLPEATSSLPEVETLRAALADARLDSPSTSSDSASIFAVQTPNTEANRQSASAFRGEDAHTFAIGPTEVPPPICRGCDQPATTHIVGFRWECEPCHADVWSVEA